MNEMDKQHFSDNHLLYPKFLALQHLLLPLLKEGLVIAFSGGVDSSFLMWSAVQSLDFMKKQHEPGRLLALLAISPSIPAWEIDDAKRFASSLAIELVIK